MTRAKTAVTKTNQGAGETMGERVSCSQRLRRGLLALAVTACAAIGVLGAVPGSALADFGLLEHEVKMTNADGSPSTQAGSHPFAQEIDEVLRGRAGAEPQLHAVADLFQRARGGLSLPVVEIHRRAYSETAGPADQGSGRKLRFYLASVTVPEQAQCRFRDQGPGLTRIST